MTQVCTILYFRYNTQKNTWLKICRHQTVTLICAMRLGKHALLDFGLCEFVLFQSQELRSGTDNETRKFPLPSAFLFILKVFSGVEVRALFRLFNFFPSNLDKSRLYLHRHAGTGLGLLVPMK